MKRVQKYIASLWPVTSRYSKRKQAFSRMALDQVHEQNNKYVKSVSGATSLVNRQDELALVRWELCGPELCRVLQDFEGECNHHDDKLAKHNEDNKTFQNDFFSDVLSLQKFPPQSHSTNRSNCC